MRTYIFYFIALLSFCSCSHKITRTGYSVNKSEYRNCDIAIKRSMAASDTLEKVGEIKLEDTGVSTSCSEEHALEILRKEGCAVQADIVNIVEEKKPNIMSSCYRCRAEFYKLKNPGAKVVSDEHYRSELVTSRVQKDRKKNAGVIIGSLVVGFAIGFLLVMIGSQ